MRIASIDIGSNTVLLLIADLDSDSRELKTVLNLYEMPRIGKGLSPGKPISDSSQNQLFWVLDKYSEVIKNNNCEITIVTATNAFRIASNKDSISEQISQKYGYSVDIINGETEAYYSYLGASSILENSDRILVIDIGGGSTELLLGDINSIIFRKSFSVGAVVIKETYFAADPPEKDEIINAAAFVNDEFGTLQNLSYGNFKTIAVAGTPTTLSCIKQDLREYVDSKVEGSELSIGDMIIIEEQLSKMESKEIKKKYGAVVNGREDIIYAGTIILKTIMELLKIDKVIVSGRGIRYGAIYNYINNLK